MKKRVSAFLVLLILITIMLPAVTASPFIGFKTQGNWVYEIVGKNVLIVKYTGREKRVVVPNEIEGKAVRFLSQQSVEEQEYEFPRDDPFDNNYYIQELVLSESAGYYFSVKDCKNLKKIVISEDIDDINIEGCPSLESVEVSSKNKYYTSQNGVVYNKNMDEIMYYPPGKKDKTYTTPINCRSAGFIEKQNYLTEINVTNERFASSLFNGGIENLPAVKKINLPKDSSRFISDNGNIYNQDKTELFFYADKGFVDFHIPVSVSRIRSGAFRECNINKLYIPQNARFDSEFYFNDIAENENFNIKEIVLDGSNYQYKIIEGALFTKYSNVLILYPTNSNRTKFSIPKGIAEIYFPLLKNCKNLKELEIPENFSGIKKNGGFYDFSVSLPKNLERITISPNDKNFCSINGVVYDKQITELVGIPKGYNQDLVIPKTVRKVSAPLYGLKNVKIEQGNNYLSIQDGAIYNQKRTKLISFVVNKKIDEFILPNTVERASSYSFDYMNVKKIVINRDLRGPVYIYNDNVETLIFGDDVTKIGNDFQLLTCNLKKVKFGKSIKSIGLSLYSDLYIGDNKVIDFFSGKVYGYKKTVAEKYCENNFLRFVEIKQKKESKNPKAISNKNVFSKPQYKIWVTVICVIWFSFFVILFIHFNKNRIKRLIKNSKGNDYE